MFLQSNCMSTLLKIDEDREIAASFLNSDPARHQKIRCSRHFWHCIRDAQGACLDGPDRTAVYLHPPGITVQSPLYNVSNATTTFLNQIQLFQCLLAVLEGKEADQRHLDQLHDNEAFEDDEGIAESGM